MDSYLNLEVLESSDLDVMDHSTVEVLGEDNRLAWSDDDEEPTTLLLKLSVAFHLANDTGSGGRNRVNATLLDQYGDPVRGERVHFRSGDPDGLYQDGVDPDVAPDRLPEADQPPRCRHGQLLPGQRRPGNRDHLGVHRGRRDNGRARNALLGRGGPGGWAPLQLPDDHTTTRAATRWCSRAASSVRIWSPSTPTTSSNVNSDTETFESFKENLEKAYEDYLDEELEVFLDFDVQGHDRDDVNSFTRYE